MPACSGARPRCTTGSRPTAAYIHRELKHDGVTLQLLWEEYARVHPNSYRRTQSPDLAFNFTGMRSMTLEPRSPGLGVAFRPSP